MKFPGLSKTSVSINWPKGKAPDLSQCGVGKRASVTVKGKVTSLHQDEWGSGLSLDVEPKAITLGSMKDDMAKLQKSRKMGY